MEGSSGLRFESELEEGPGQKQEIRKWRGPVTSSLSGFRREDPARKRKIRKWKGPVTSSLTWLQREDPSRTKKIRSRGVQ